MTSHRDQVLTLISQVSDARYRAFKTHAQALSFYMDAKEKGFVKVVRDPGDDALFGPSHKAMQ